MEAYTEIKEFFQVAYASWSEQDGMKEEFCSQGRVGLLSDIGKILIDLGDYCFGIEPIITDEDRQRVADSVTVQISTGVGYLGGEDIPSVGADFGLGGSLTSVLIGGGVTSTGGGIYGGSSWSSSA